MKGFVATATVDIAATPERVWSALTEPDQIAAYMFGTEVTTDWVVGGPITWKGEYEGRSYEDKVEIVEIDPPRRLTVTHYSPLSGQPDVPDSYHTLRYELTGHDDGTRLSLAQDNNPTEQAAEHSRGNWESMLRGLKEFVERS